MHPPQTERRPFAHREHGAERDDPYHWLASGDDPAVNAHLEAENVYANARLAHLGDLQRTLVRETTARTADYATTGVVEHGPWEYYRRAEPSADGPLYCRRPRGGGPEQILVDHDALSEGQTYLRVTEIEPSPDHRFLAVVLDTSGNERTEVAFLDMASGTWLPDRLRNAEDVAWATDGRSILWCALDEAKRAWRIHRHVLGTTGPDPVVYEEADPELWVTCQLSESGAWLLLGSLGRVTTEFSVVPADAPETPPRLLHPRQRGLRYFPTVVGDTLWILTNDNAVNNRLMRAPLDAPSKEHWREVIAHRADVHLEELHAFAGHLVLSEREAGQVRLRVHDLATGADHIVVLPEEVYQVALDDSREPNVSFSNNREFDTPFLTLVYISLTTQKTTYRYHMADRTLQQVHRVPVPGHDPLNYRTFRRHAVAPDGTQIPITLVHRADVTPSADTPLFVFAYGAYGDVVTPEFRLPHWSFLSRGGVFAIAHVRGGGHLGRPWYEAGRLAHKHNTFTDFIAVVRGLHAGGFGSPKVTAIRGMSGGGLLVGAVLNQAPEICTVAIANVPFVDVLTAMMDVTLPLTTFEWEEWGDPRKRDVYRQMAAYSPYDNVTAQAYPDVMVTVGRNDPSVPYWGPAKWVAKLRATAMAGDFLLLTDMNAGHRGPSGRAQVIEEGAWRTAWLLERLGMAG